MRDVLHEPRDWHGRWTIGSTGKHHTPGDGGRAEAAKRFGGGSDPLPAGWQIVHDKPRRVVMYDTNTTDSWYKKYGIGFLTWNDEGQISWVQTGEDYLRKGVATHLLNYVRNNIRPDIRHSDELSESGAAFMEADIRRTKGRR